MKKFLVAICLSLFLPLVAHAEVYKNEQFNFQVKFPPGWSESIDYLIKNSLMEKYQLIKDKEEFLGIIAINAVNNQNPNDGQLIVDFTDENKRQEFLLIVKQKITAEFPNAVIRSAEFSTINNNPVLIINYDILFPDLILKRADAYMLLGKNYIVISLMTDNLEDDIYFAQFLQVLESCQTLPTDI